MEEGPTLGIDFGTSMSSAAIREEGETRVVTNYGDEGADSTISITEDGEIIVGGIPTNISTSYPDRIVGSAKQFLTEVGTDPVDHHRPQVLAGAVLRQLKQNAEERLGEEVPSAVIAVPSCFDSRQRQATRDAATIAGFDHLSLIDETTATAVAH